VTSVRVGVAWAPMTLRALFLSLPLSLSFALAGCGGDSMEADAERFVKLADEVCACKDAACAENVKKKWDALEDELDKKYEGKKDVDEAAMKKAMAKAEAAESRAKECGKKLAGGGAEPTTDGQ
jgi:hypothetical protein